MKIEFDPLDNSSISDAIKQLKKYKTDTKKKETKCLEKLGGLGKTIAEAVFTNAIEVYNGSPIHANVDPISVTNNKISANSFHLLAKGNNVAFVEFGAGIKYGFGYPATQVTGVPGRPSGIVGIGEYGLGQGANPKGWWYKKNGVKTHSYGNPPAMAMYKAEEEIVSKATQVTKEVFRNGG